MNLKLEHIYLIIVTTALLSTIITASVLSTTSTSTFYISGGIYPGAPAYTVWTEEGTYFAKNMYGLIEFSGLDAGVVLQSSISALQGNVHGYLSGKIQVKNGQYNITSALIIQNPNIILEGEGRATEFLVTNTTLDYVIKIVSSMLAPENTYTHAVQIKNILFWSPTAQSTYGIYFNNVAGIIWFPLVQDCFFININGIRTDPNAFGINQVLQFPKFERLFITSPTNCGINLTNVIDARLTDIIVFSSTTQMSTVGIYINATITSGIVIDKVEIVRQGYGIYIVQSDDTQIINSFFDLCNNSYAVKIDSSSRVEIAHTYAHAPYGTAFLISGTSNQTRLISCTAKMSAVGVNDTTTDCIQYFIGFISATDNTVQWDIDATDVVRGCLGKADQG